MTLELFRAGFDVKIFMMVGRIARDLRSTGQGRRVAIRYQALSYVCPGDGNAAGDNAMHALVPEIRSLDLPVTSCAEYIVAVLVLIRDTMASLIRRMLLHGPLSAPKPAHPCLSLRLSCARSNGS